MLKLAELPGLAPELVKPSSCPLGCVARGDVLLNLGGNNVDPRTQLSQLGDRRTKRRSRRSRTRPCLASSKQATFEPLLALRHAVERAPRLLGAASFDDAVKLMPGLLAIETVA